MSWKDRLQEGYFPWLAGLAALLAMLWWGGMLSSSGNRVEGVSVSEARILEVHDRAWLVQLKDGRRARIMVDNARRKRIGDVVRVRVSHYDDGHDEAVIIPN